MNEEHMTAAAGLLCLAPDDPRRVRCEVWTRVMGYHRPVSAFNPGKQSEHRERKMFVEPGWARSEVSYDSCTA